MCSLAVKIKIKLTAQESHIGRLTRLHPGITQWQPLVGLKSHLYGFWFGDAEEERQENFVLLVYTSFGFRWKKTNSGCSSTSVRCCHDLTEYTTMFLFDLVWVYIFGFLQGSMWWQNLGHASDVKTVAHEEIGLGKPCWASIVYPVCCLLYVFVLILLDMYKYR